LWHFDHYCCSESLGNVQKGKTWVGQALAIGLKYIATFRVAADTV